MPRRTTRAEDPMLDRLTAMILAAATALEAALEILEEWQAQNRSTGSATTTNGRRKRRRAQRKSAT